MPTEINPALQEAFSALDTLREQHSTVRALAGQLGYQLPGDSIDPDLIQRDIAANMRRSVEACLEVGRGLRVLKEACGHGNFMSRLDVLGIEESVARRFMQAATKFTNRALTHDFTKAIGSQTKLFEMLILDDEQIDELMENGKTGDVTLDDIATKSVKELRETCRKLRDENAAKTRVLVQKDEKINELSVALEKRDAPKAATKPKVNTAAQERAELEEQLIKNLQDASLVMLGTINGVAQAVGDIYENEPGESLTTAAEQTVTWLFQSVAKIAQDMMLPVDFTAVVRGEWFDQFNSELRGANEGVEQ